MYNESHDHKVTREKLHAQRGKARILITGKSTKAEEMC